MSVSATCSLNMTNIILLEIFGNVKCHDFLKFNLLQNKHIWSLHSSLYTSLNFVIYLLWVLPRELEPLSVIMTVVWLICSCYIYSEHRRFASSHGLRYSSDRHSLPNFKALHLSVLIVALVVKSSISLVGSAESRLSPRRLFRSQYKIWMAFSS